MNLFIKKNSRFLFYSAWLALSVIQASGTNLINDEAYYWAYSRYLSWGYFDHPPMVALLIKAGYAVFENELGVRLFFILLNTATLIITEKLIRDKNEFLFYSIVISLSALQIAGFMAVPDTPLVFFTALFFYYYSRFTNRADWVNTLLLAFAATGLIFSKYQGFLVIVFTLFSNFKLLKKYPFYLAGILTTILLIPHLIWQSQNGWVSFWFHLFSGYHNSDYQFSYTSGYILGQLLVAGPVAGFFLLPGIVNYSPVNACERALKYTLAGFLIFFFFSSFRGRVQPNWTFPVLIPLIVLSHSFIKEKIRWRLWLKYTALVTLIMTFAARIYMIKDIGPENQVKKRFHGTKEMMKNLAKKTGGLPPVFYNSYQNASQFWFYGGRPSHSLNTYNARKNNYDFWPSGDNLFCKPVYLQHLPASDGPVNMKMISEGSWVFFYDSCFSPLSKINITSSDKHYVIRSGDSLQIQFTATVPSKYSGLPDTHHLPSEVLIGVFDKKKWMADLVTGLTVQQLGAKKDHVIKTSAGLLVPGKYNLRFAIKSGHYFPLNNSNNFKLTIE